MTSALPLAIAVAPNGARRSRADHPRLPMTAAELARDAAEALEAGAAMIHLHVRDTNGRHTLDAELYRQAIAAIRKAVGDALVIQVTTEAVGRYTPAEQMAVVDELRPESASMALREILPVGGSESEAAAFLGRTVAAGTLVQIIIYGAPELERARALAARGVLPLDDVMLLAVLGGYHGGLEASTEEFDAFLKAGISSQSWMLCAFGPHEAEFMELAAGEGGHARVGFENNLMLPDGTLAPDNASLVAATAAKAAMSGRRLASADELRRLWNTPVGASRSHLGSAAQSRSGTGRSARDVRNRFNRPQGLRAQ